MRKLIGWVGYYDFRGQYTSPTFTAHPKIDAATGEMATMGYEAKGDATADVAYYLFSADGKKLEECWFQTPFAGMMHDMGMTDKWIIFIVPPLAVVPEEKLKEGHKHFAWDDERPLAFGILPRRNPKPEDIKWFYAENAFYGHTGNTFDGADGCVYLDAPLTYGNKVSRLVLWSYYKKRDNSELTVRSSGSSRRLLAIPKSTPSNSNVIMCAGSSTPAPKMGHG